jgi:hypothetical protein
MTAWLIPFALEAALRGLALAAVVGLALSVLRVRNVPARKAAWTLVLLAAFAMPLLMRAVPSRFGWVLPVRFASRSTPAMTPQPARALAPQTQPILLPQQGVEASAADASATPDRTPSAPILLSLDPGPASSAATPVPTARPVTRRAFHLPSAASIIVCIYCAVTAVLLLRLFFGLFAAIRLWIGASRVSPLVAPEPSVRSSSRIASPVTIGSGIVLPADYTHWDARKLRMVMAHERSHVRQLDFYLQLLAGLYAALFWFSPLGWWLRRTLSALGESISDRAGLAAAQSPSGYASLVLEFAALPHKLLPGVAMACSTNLSRRVDSMLNENLFRTLFSEGRRRAMASLLVIPAALFAVTALVRVPSAAAQSAPQNTQPPPAQTPAQTPPQTQTTGQSNPPETQITNDAAPDAAPAALTPDQAMPAPPPMPAAPQGEGTTVIPLGAPQTPPPPQASPAPPAAAPPQPDDSLVQDSDSGMWVRIPKVQIPKIPNVESLTLSKAFQNDLAMKSYMDGTTLLGSGDNLYFLGNGGVHGDAYYFSSNGDSWALVSGPGTHITLGDGATKDQLDLAQRMAKGPFLWFSHGGKSYIVDDPAIVAQIQSLYAPMKDLSRQEQELGVQERVLGRMDEEIARSMRDNNTVRLPDLSKEMADAQAALDSLKTQEGQTLSEEKLAEMQAKLAEVEARLGALEAKAASQNNSGERMRALGDQQRQLGEQQRQLGEQQKKLSEQAEQQVKNLIQQCLSNGKATPVK